MSASEYDQLRFEERNYESYLKLPELLGLQKQVSDPPHHDEMFFIIIHQASELWFKLILHETTLLVSALREQNIHRAIKVIKRMSQVMDLLVRQINLLSTLTPVEFAGFRSVLNPASGFQSLQFRKLEYIYGLRSPFFIQFFTKLMPAAAQELQDIRKEPSVYDEFIFCLQRAGFAVPAELLKRDWSQDRQVDPGLVAVLKGIYENEDDQYEWNLICEALFDFDEKLTLWRYTHITMVARTIGSLGGTGGSSGVPFLESRAKERLFPDLWAVRNELGGLYGDA